MFDKMVKMKNKRGFTLVEMLVVIAIIAILVSIIIPTVSKSTTKANAATNAANMRAVKGTVSTMLVSGDIDLSDVQPNSAVIAEAEEVVADLKSNPLTYFLGLAAEYVLDGLKRVDNASSTYYAQDGMIDINGTILTAPVSKEIKVGDLTLRKGTEMTVTVSKNDIIVTYAGLPIEVMALIAQGGDYTELDMSSTGHTYIDSNGDNVCDICNGAFEHDVVDQIFDSVQNTISGAHSCSDSTADCICDDPNCGMKIPCVDSNWDYNCDNCGAVQAHGHYDDNADGVCDVNNCDKSADHSCKDNDWNYVCDAELCKLPIKHGFYDSTGCTGDSDVNCDLCGKPEGNTAYHN